MSTSDSVIEQAKDIAKQEGYIWSGKLEQLLRFGTDHSEYLPTRKKVADLHDGSYLTQYIKAYYNDLNRILTFKDASTKPDPAVDEVLEAFAHEHNLSMSPGEVVSAHRYSMAAENLIGLFLERYLASHLEQVGWVWCCGSTLHAIDFLRLGRDGAYELLQVKNRSNSENSSSSAIRKGTIIQKWHRIDSRTGRCHWDKLPDNAGDALTEEGFYTFIRDYVASHRE